MILVDIYIPAVDRVFDFELDEKAKIQYIMSEIIEMIAKETKSSNLGKVEDFLLYDMSRAIVFRRDETLEAYGIQTGSKLMLV